MPIGSTHSITRQGGTAIAALALYLLLLLVPWHQAAALQHELDALGYASAASVDICGELPAGPEGGATGVKCPVAGIGKFEFTGLAPGGAVLDLPRRVHAVAYAVAPLSLLPARVLGAHRPRAPPATV